ncbi:hypothetical protein A0128_21550 [Leptospira tipperaryensis]|uniref:CopG family transcriptional regulator n=1 Tax=Leptospira tipperaryensis TaxID=2564040 RepID=A0A1D7V443_9LEPT|nr:DUF1564 domain-containing protein [Leptospira tipperaryensis]AOP36588.1 hypothetical protein A0128_21550 [Leptospira tipperaryensis]
MEMLSIRSDQVIESALVEKTSDVVTVILPENYYFALNPKEQRDLKRKLPFLLSRYGKYLAGASRLNTKAGKILYQKNQGKMKRINFRVESGMWNILGMLALSHGVSRCFLFHYMLILESLGVGDSIVQTMNAGPPTFHRVYSFIWQLDLQSKRIFRKLEFDPNPIFPIFYGMYWAKSF